MIYNLQLTLPYTGMQDTKSVDRFVKAAMLLTMR